MKEGFASKEHLTCSPFAPIFCAMVFALFLIPTLAWGAEIWGRITRPNNAPVANAPIQMNGKPVGQTEPAGYYRLNLAPGQYRLTIEGQDVPIVVPPPGVQQDIRLQK
jgi:hypothetical protein